MDTDPTPTAKPAEWQTLPEIARELRIRESKPIGWIRAGLLPAINLGTEARPRYRVRRSDLETFLESRRVAADVRPTRRQRRDSSIPRYV
ncbi:MAG: helix-turn-helix domain-containing protein [Pirellulaceae bacterium]|nr:helix-turn-helix domain-containing protein [Pirellulaceae bacterium]